MTNRQLARIHAALRVRQRLRQIDVATAAGVGRWKVSLLEAGLIDDLKLGELRRLFEAIGARLDVVASWRGAELSRLLDEGHARLLSAVMRILQGLGWMVQVEVSFSIGGEHGSIDILAWHPSEQALLVVEIKSELPGIDPLLRPLDVKIRHASGIARTRFGWHAATVSRVVVLPEERTARRQVGRHQQLLGGALPGRSREVRRWLRRPIGAISGLWFLSVDGSVSTARNPSAIRRVQRPRSRTNADASPRDDLDRRLIDPHRVGPLDN